MERLKPKQLKPLVASRPPKKLKPKVPPASLKRLPPKLVTSMDVVVKGLNRSASPKRMKPRNRR